MDINNFDGNASLVLERIMSSYGVATQKALSEATGIPTNTVSNWVQRNSVPSNVILKCSVDTGADARWLVTGELAKADSSQPSRALKGKPLYDKILASGGKAVLRRILDAYGFDTQKELGDLLNISSGTISTWVRRNFFPGDVVIACALDTGVSLEWLSTGSGAMQDLPAGVKNSVPGAITLECLQLVAGKLEPQGQCIVDNRFLPKDISQDSLRYIYSGSRAWLISFDSFELSNGTWLLDIDGTLDVYSVSRRPGNRLRVSGKDGEFECSVDEVKARGVVASCIKQLL
ncbi:helix-turn-helix domain-containing protein [Sodalis sp. RH15]|uniref:helix-turn-helix domain-containing protein n=1 Tax=Sodalis sp. RH15 TaxID=3394330 RepID=UPI0039B45920